MPGEITLLFLILNNVQIAKNVYNVKIGFKNVHNIDNMVQKIHNLKNVIENV